MANNSKSPGLAGFLSFIVPGLGQVYNKQYVKGILYFMVPFLLWNIGYIYYPYVFVFGRGLFGNFLIATILAFIIRLYSAYDAKKSAEYCDFSDITKDQFKSFDVKKLKDKRIILAILFVIFLIVGVANTDYSYEYVEPFGDFYANATVTAQDSSFELTDYSAATEDTFVADREDSQYYYGHWSRGDDAQFVYNVYMKVNLSDAKWKITPVWDDVEINESEVRDFLDENLTFMLNDLREYKNRTGDSYIEPTSIDTNDSAVDDLTLLNSNYTIKNGVLVFSAKYTTDEPLLLNHSVTYVLSARGEDNKNVEVKIIIPKENINTYDPGIETDPTHYNIETNY